MKRLILLICNLVMLSLAGWHLTADDAAARERITRAHEKLGRQEFGSAAQDFEDARLLADDAVLKANALEAAAKAWRQAKRPHREAACLREIIINYGAQADYKEILHRQYELASADYRRAIRKSASWFPWHGKAADRAVEAYELLLKQALFSDFAPELRLRLGRLYLGENRIDDALNQFRDIIRLHPGSEQECYAHFELANALVQLAKNGDGDGAYGREAQQVLRQAIEKYPDDPETVWAEEQILKANSFVAEKLLKLSRFYYSRENEEAALRYLHELLANYPASPIATDGEKLLAEIDPEYQLPEPDPRRKHAVLYPKGSIPEEPERILVPVQDSGGKWLLPVEDLGIDNWRKPEKD